VSQGILQPDMWGVKPSDRWDWDALRRDISQHGVRNSLLVRRNICSAVGKYRLATLVDTFCEPSLHGTGGTHADCKHKPNFGQQRVLRALHFQHLRSTCALGCGTRGVVGPAMINHNRRLQAIAPPCSGSLQASLSSSTST